MTVTDYYLLWKVTVPSSWIAAASGFLLAWLAVRIKYGKSVAELLGDAILTTIIVWKLSVIVTDFETVRAAPFALLYFNGGRFGFLSGILIAALFIRFSRKPKPLSVSRGLLLGVICAQAGYQVMMAILNDGTPLSTGVTLVLFTVMAVFAFVRIDDESIPVLYVAGLFIAIHAFIAALQPAGFTGIPFAATVVASVLVVMISSRFTQSQEIDGGIR